MRQLILPVIFIAMISCNLITQSKSEPVTVTAPKSEASNFETNDSSFLKLKIKEDKFEIEFLNKVSLIDNIDKLDTFFQKNIALVNKEKIVITDFDTTPKNKNLRDLLTKYGFSRFRVNTEKNQ